MARSGFKMKYSPAKGRLDDFFSSLGKQLKRNRRDIGGEFKGVKQKDKARMLENKADAEYYGSAEDKAKNSEANRIKPAVTEEPKSKGDYYTFSGKKGDKFKYRSKSDGSDFDLKKSYEFQRPGSDVWETPKTKAGGKAIHDLYMDDKTKIDDITPIQKRSKGFKMPGYGKRK